MLFLDAKVIDPYVEIGRSPELKMALASDQDVNAVEAKLGLKLPTGYREYVTRLGEGVYCRRIRINMPAEILQRRDQHRDYINEFYDFWEPGWDILPKSEALDSIELGSTLDGDIIILVPAKSNDIYVLPHEDDYPYRIGHDLDESLEFLFKKRYPAMQPSERHFVPTNPLAYDHGMLWPEDI